MRSIVRMILTIVLAIYHQALLLVKTRVRLRRVRDISIRKSSIDSGMVDGGGLV